jgi:hypothetical protein
MSEYQRMSLVELREALWHLHESFLSSVKIGDANNTRLVSREIDKLMVFIDRKLGMKNL